MMASELWGRNAAELKAFSIYYTSQHVHVLKVLRGVLYPEAH